MPFSFKLANFTVNSDKEFVSEADYDLIIDQAKDEEEFSAHPRAVISQFADGDGAIGFKMNFNLFRLWRQSPEKTAEYLDYLKKPFTPAVQEALIEMAAKSSVYVRSNVTVYDLTQFQGVPRILANADDTD